MQKETTQDEKKTQQFLLAFILFWKWYVCDTLASIACLMCMFLQWAALILIHFSITSIIKGPKQIGFKGKEWSHLDMHTCISSTNRIMNLLEYPMIIAYSTVEFFRIEESRYGKSKLWLMFVVMNISCMWLPACLPVVLPAICEHNTLV